MVSAEEFLNRGIAKLNQGDLPGAIANLDEAIKLKPGLAEAWGSRGIAKEGQGDLPGAITDYDEAIKLDPDYAEAWGSRGIAKAKQKDLPGAIADLDKAIKLDPDYAEAWGSRGAAKAEQGDLPGATADLDKAIRLKPDYAKSWYNRGLVKHTQEDLPGAIADYDEAIKLDPNLVAAWGNRGVAKQAQSDLRGAIADYDEFIKLKPDLAKAWNYRGMAKEAQSDLQHAITDYYKAIKLAEAWSGTAKEDQEDLSGAIADYDEAIKLDSNLVAAWVNRGIAKEKQGDLPGAIVDYDEAIKLKPDLAEAWSNRGIAKAKQRDLPGAIVDYDEAIKFDSDYAEAWNNRGVVKEIQGDLPSAIVDYDKAIELKPDLVAARINHAIVTDALNTKVSPEEIRKIFYKSHSSIDQLLTALREDKKKDQFNPMHYTNLYTLQNLAEGGKFRLYDAKSMDDSEEGNVLFDLFNVDDGLREKMRKTFRDESSEDLEVFIGSFVTANNIDYGDDLIWRTYGKHNGEERAGCALVFDKEQLFSFEPLPLANLLEARLLEARVWASRTKDDRANLLEAGLLEARSDDLAGKEQDESVPNKECYLYPVCYKDTKEVTEIQPKVDDLCKALQLCDKKYEEMCKMVAVLLNQVRYLFKSAIYQREQEYRLTIVRARNSPAVQKDPLRTYVESSLDMEKVTVLLGPEAKEVETWEKWLKEKDSFKKIKTTNTPS